MRKKREKLIRENNIKQIREERGWTQQELANKTNLTKGYISKLESGSELTMFTTEIIANAFSIPIESIYKITKKTDIDFVIIKFIKDIKKYNAYKHLDEIKDYEYLSVGRAFLKYFYDANDYDDIIIIVAPDNTMMPNICEGDLIFINKNEKYVKKPGIYILEDNEIFTIKRIIFIGEEMNRIKITIDNKLDLNFTETNSSIEKIKDKICGRIVAYTRNIF